MSCILVTLECGSSHLEFVALIHHQMQTWSSICGKEDTLVPANNRRAWFPPPNSKSSIYGANRDGPTLSGPSYKCTRSNDLPKYPPFHLWVLSGTNPTSKSRKEEVRSQHLHHWHYYHSSKAKSTWCNLGGSIGRCCVLPNIVLFYTHFFRPLKPLVISRGTSIITQFP